MSKHIRDTGYFSLIEILLVVGIMVILMAIATPGFVKTLRGQGSEFAARTVSTKLNLARSYAISKRQYVALLMPQAGYPAASSPLNKYIHSAYRPCIVEKNDTSYYFQQWIQGENWEFLPDGVSIVEVDSDDGVNLDAYGNLAPANGTITLISPSPLPGTTPNKGVDCSDIGGSSSVTDFAGIIFKPSGIATAGRFIEIAEAKYEPSAGGVIVTNKKSASYVSIKIDQYTGRVTYGNK